MRILCCCEHGNTRSVALAYLIKTIYGYDALACGVRETSLATKIMLFNWADKIILMEKSFADLVNINPENKKKVSFCDIGKDIWFNPKDQGLIHKLLKELKHLDL